MRMRERARGQRSRGWLTVPCERPIDPIENSSGITNFFAVRVGGVDGGLRGHHVVRHDGEDAPRTCRAQGRRAVRCGKG